MLQCYSAIIHIYWMIQLLVNILIQFKLTKDLSIFTANNVEKVMMNNLWNQSLNRVLFIILSNNHLIRFLKGKTKYIMQNLNSAEY